MKEPSKAQKPPVPAQPAAIPADPAARAALLRQAKQTTRAAGIIGIAVEGARLIRELLDIPLVQAQQRSVEAGELTPHY